MASIRAKLDGDLEELMDKLTGLKEIDKEGLNAAIAEALRTGTVERFDKGQSPEGASWPRSIRASGGGKTLVATAALKNSIHARASSEGAEVGTNLIYAATHQFGASGRTIRARNKPYLAFQVGGRWVRKKQVTVNIPARPYLGISADDRAEIIALAEEVINGV